MHLAQVVSFVSLCATRTWKNWKTPSTLKLSLTECAGVDYDYNAPSIFGSSHRYHHFAAFSFMFCVRFIAAVISVDPV